MLQSCKSFLPDWGYKPPKEEEAPQTMALVQGRVTRVAAGSEKPGKTTKRTRPAMLLENPTQKAYRISDFKMKGFWLSLILSCCTIRNSVYVRGLTISLFLCRVPRTGSFL